MKKVLSTIAVMMILHGAWDAYDNQGFQHIHNSLGEKVYIDAYAKEDTCYFPNGWVSLEGTWWARAPICILDLSYDRSVATYDKKSHEIKCKAGYHIQADNIEGYPYCEKNGDECGGHGHYDYNKNNDYQDCVCDKGYKPDSEADHHDGTWGTTEECVPL